MGEGRARGLKLADTRPCGVPGQNLPRGRIQTARSMRLPTLAEEIALDAPLLGPGGLGLDSIDALQSVVALDTHEGIKITDPGTAKVILQNVLTMAKAISTSQAAWISTPQAVLETSLALTAATLPLKPPARRGGRIRRGRIGGWWCGRRV